MACMVAFSWLSARPMHVVEHLTSWWLMFLTYSTGFCLCGPKWPHKQGGFLACWGLQDCEIKFRLRLSCTDLYYGWGAYGLLPMRVDLPYSQLDLPPLTPLSVSWLWSTATRSSSLGYFSMHCLCSSRLAASISVAGWLWPPYGEAV